MAPVNPKDMVIQVEDTTPGTWLEVKHGRAYASDIDSPLNIIQVFNNSSGFAFAGQDNERYTLEFLIDYADAGQNRVRTLARAKTAMNLRFFPTGGTVNGWSHSVVAGNRSQQADPDGNPMIQRFEVAGNGVAPVAVGTGITPP